MFKKGHGATLGRQNWHGGFFHLQTEGMVLPRLLHPSSSTTDMQFSVLIAEASEWPQDVDKIIFLHEYLCV